MDRGSAARRQDQRQVLEAYDVRTSAVRVPSATCRIQLNADFRFAEAREIIPMLRDMEITDFYSSPIFRARKGSTHGYDVTDPLSINPELGTEDDFQAFVDELHANGMKLLIDIVPNHMAASTENPWWADVLENGPGSEYAACFDIDWKATGGKLILPILGSPYDEVLSKQELRLALDEDGLSVNYYEHRLPVDPRTFRTFIEHRLDEARSAFSPAATDELISLLVSVSRLPPRDAAERRRGAAADLANVKGRLWRLADKNRAVKAFFDANLAEFNGTKGDPASFALLDGLLSEQAYSLVFWKTAREHLNYRRFFDISDLVGVRVEDPEVFALTHQRVLEMVRRGQVDGLRVDHVDGLFDPTGYLQQLQDAVARARGDSTPFYIVVEKILLGSEDLPQEWPVCGATGYEFYNRLNGIFVAAGNLPKFDDIYARFIGRRLEFSEVAHEQKRKVLATLFPGELRRLGEELESLACTAPLGRDVDPEVLKATLREFAGCLPVYRTYVRSFDVRDEDREVIARAAAEVRLRNPDLPETAVTFVHRVLALDFPDSLAPDEKYLWLRFTMRWQQLTGPATAKGVEDTGLYIYNRLISMNSVGSDGHCTTPREFHEFNRQRQYRWPFGLSTTETHDSKRSEDVRVRIDVLSEIPEEWHRAIERWAEWNAPKKLIVDGAPVPDRNEEYLLYQVLLGGWPIRAQKQAVFQERVRSYLVKAAREAKVHTSWTDSNPEYEEALVKFADTILEPSDDNRFVADFTSFEHRLSKFGALNSLSQVLLKITCPGVPDFFQRTMLWDLSLVDPDNRRPVNFPRRVEMLSGLHELEDLAEPARLAARLLSTWEDGRVKLYTMMKALRFRKERQDLFLRGDYIPIAASGAAADHVFAFARRNGGRWAVVAVPRCAVSLCRDGLPPLGSGSWGDTRLVLPDSAPWNWTHQYTAEAIEAPQGWLALASVFRTFPVALLEPAETER